MAVYNKIKYWVDNYAASSTDDKRAVENFMECETREVVASFRGELIQVANRNFNPDSLQILIGGGRTLKHGSFEEWAKIMLQWMAISPTH